MDYLVLVLLPAYSLSPDKFRIESAFAEHLRELREQTKDKFDRLVVMSPSISDERYKQVASSLEEVDSGEGICFVPLHVEKPSLVRFWLKDVFSVSRKGWVQIGRSGLVHTGMTSDVKRPFLAILNFLAFLRRKKMVFMVDIDNRRSAWMSYKTGRLSLKSYLLAKFIYDPLLFSQISLAVRCCSLVLLKSARLVDDFGKGKPHVRNFYDAAHSDEYIIPPDRLKAKKAQLIAGEKPLKFVFFGRFVGYKGLDHSIRAIHKSCELSGRPFEFTLIGRGEEKAALEALVDELSLKDRVRFLDSVPYGQGLFDLLYEQDVCLATPLAEDTPRAAFDAMGAGLPVLAYDINYYRDLEQTSGAAATATWPEPDRLAEAMIALDGDRPRLAEMSAAGVKFAAENTQQIWVERRIQWTFE